MVPGKLAMHQPQRRRLGDLVRKRPVCSQLWSDGSHNTGMPCYGNGADGQYPFLIPPAAATVLTVDNPLNSLDTNGDGEVDTDDDGLRVSGLSDDLAP